MNEHAKVVMSNRLEVLADLLYKNLFTESEVFEKRLVIVGHPLLKRFLLHRFAKTKGIAAGFKIVGLNRAFEVPSILEIGLVLQCAMRESKNEELCKYLQEDKEKRIITLSAELASSFLKRMPTEKWQKELWQEVFKEPLIHPYEKLKRMPFFEGQVHVFGFGYLPVEYLQFFKKQKAVLYHLSPCNLFWGDADGENSLLDKLGKVGKTMLNLLQDCDFIFEEEYVENQRQTFLENVQQDLLELTKEECSGDQTITLHKALSKLHEVEILKENICRLGCFEDCIVMAPDISEYAPFIHKVFADTDYSIFDENKSFLEMVHLLSLIKGRFEVDEIFKLFSFESFLKKFNLKSDEVHLFRKWVKKAHISWGKDLPHRQFVLGGTASEIGTWEYGFYQLLKALAVVDDELDISFNEAETLGKFIEIIRSLFSYRKEASLCYWFSYLKELATTYFVLDDESQSFLDKLNKLSISLKPIEEKIFSYEAMEKMACSLLTSKAPYQPNNLHGIRFCSWGSAGPISAKALFLLNMEEKSGAAEDIYPSKTEEERYLFLQLLTNAESFFTMSFVENPSIGALELKVPIISHCIKPTGQKFPVMFPEFYQEIKIQTKSENKNLTIDIKDLNQLARHPIKFYFNRALKIYLDNQEDLISKEFVLSALDKYKLRNDASYLESFEKAHSRGAMPLGVFKQAARLGLEEELNQREIIKTHSCKLNLKVPLEDGREALIIGTLENVTDAGLLFHTDHYLNNQIKAYPSYLVHLALGQTPRLIFSKKNKSLELPLAEPFEKLSCFISYYERCLQTPSPFMPDWADPLLKRDAKGLQKKIESDFFEDPYLKWIFLKDPYFCAEALIANWAGYLKGVFAL